MIAGRRSGLRIGADVGGTFTDIVLADESGHLLVHKVSSTPAKPEAAVIRGVAEILETAQRPAADVTEVLHGTTVGSNTILEKKGAQTGLLTTRGFRDVLEIGRVRTPNLFDLSWSKPEPLVPRRHRLEVDERIAGDGTVVTPLDADGVVAAAERLVAAGVESIAVCLINSYRNGEHEHRIGQLLKQHFPTLAVTASFDVLPEIKEYERTSTTVVNAYVLPVMRRYLQELATGLASIGVSAPLLVVASDGSVVGAATAAAKPAFFIGSGPAAGASGAAKLGIASRTPDLIAFDMGGTTAKASLVQNGAVTRTSEYEFRAGISMPSRFIKAGGYMLKVPAIEIVEVGSGAGSIAFVDPAGLLKVGPTSAGADPGPACYGKGGDHPTVTDANVVLGHLNPDYLAGGALRLDRRLAASTIERHIAGPLGLSLIDAADGIRQVVNANMARALRAVTVERGLDPRDLALVAFGGSGPVHACDLAEMLGIRRILMPSLPGVFTAVGMLTGDVQRHFVRAFPAPLDAVDLVAANRILDELREAAVQALRCEGYEGSRQHLTFEADLRFVGQDSELAIGLDTDRLDAAPLAELRARFHREYERTYQYRGDDSVEIVNLRVIGRGDRASKIELGETAVRRPATSRAGGERPVFFSRRTGFVTTPVVDRVALIDRRMGGPLVVESYDTTIVVPPGASVAADAAGNLVVEPAIASQDQP